MRRKTRLLKKKREGSVLDQGFGGRQVVEGGEIREVVVSVLRGRGVKKGLDERARGRFNGCFFFSGPFLKEEKVYVGNVNSRDEAKKVKARRSKKEKKGREEESKVRTGGEERWWEGEKQQRETMDYLVCRGVNSSKQQQQQQ